jgi:hypothetical protein
MIKNYSSPKRAQNNSKGKETKEKSPRIRNEQKMIPRSKLEQKQLSKSYKDHPGSRSGNLALSSAMFTKSPRLNTEASDSSIRYKDGKSLSKSPRANLTDLFQYSQESTSRLQIKSSENKSKSLKSLKNKLLAKIKRKESIGKTVVKPNEELPKPEIVKKLKIEKSEKKTLKKNISKKVKVKKTSKTGKKRKHREGEEGSFYKNKEKILKRLSDLNDRINSFKLDAHITCRNTVDQIHKAATKIQSNIRGFLVRKVFSQTLKRLKENRLREAELEKLKKKHLTSVEKELNKIQLRSLMEMRENDLLEVSELLRGCENLGNIKKNLEEIINRRYMVLSQTMGIIHPIQKVSPVRPTVITKSPNSPENLSEKPQKIQRNSSKDSEKTPKKQMNIFEKYSHNENSFENPSEPVIFQISSCCLPPFSPEPVPNQPVLPKIDKNSERIKQKRVLFELEVFIFNCLFEEVLKDLSNESENSSLNKIKTKVPIRNFNIFTETVQNFSTDVNSLLSHLNRVLLHNKPEKVLKKVGKYWSSFNLIFKLDDFLLEKYRNFSYFLENNSMRGDKLKKIYRNFEIETFNEALSLAVHECVPRPWIYQFQCDVNFELLLKNVKKTLEKWAGIEAGKIPDVGMLNCLGVLNEDVLQTSRENNLEKIVQCDVVEEDMVWVDLKYHETGLVLCLEDDILVDLIMEVAFLA